LWKLTWDFIEVGCGDNAKIIFEGYGNKTHKITDVGFLDPLYNPLSNHHHPHSCCSENLELPVLLYSKTSN
jgi:hypothetical protein